MHNPSKKMGLEAGWEGPYYIFLRFKYDFSEQELNDEGALICILHVMKDRTFLRHHGQLINLPSFGASYNFVGHKLFVKEVVTYVTRELPHCGLAIYIKKYLKAKKELWKFKYFTMQIYSFQKIL